MHYQLSRGEQRESTSVRPANRPFQRLRAKDRARTSDLGTPGSAERGGIHSRSRDKGVNSQQLLAQRPGTPGWIPHPRPIGKPSGP